MYHFKDSTPSLTVERIREILFDLKISVTEKHNKALGGLVHSLILSICGTKVSVNGKGVTRELATASAYGELMERLQNNMLYPVFPNSFSTLGLYSKYGFASSPLEKRMPIQQCWDNLPDHVRRSVFKIELENSSHLLEESRILALDVEEGKVTCAPFYRLLTDEAMFLPMPHLSLIYGSNGMCAGNTPEEALVQGISEIIERYVTIIAIKQREVLPTIPHELIAEFFPEAYEGVKLIESHEKYRIVIKDCSMNMNLPVIAGVLINQEEGTCFIRFGAHPQINVAIERVITEMFQNRQLSDFSAFRKMRLLSKDDEIAGKDNINSIITNGIGYYPLDLLSESSEEYILPDHFRLDFESNTDCLMHLLKMIESLEWDIYIQDNSYLGFPTYRIIIPSVSEVYETSAVEYKRLSEHKKMSELAKKLPLLDNDSLELLASYLKGSILAGKKNSLTELAAPYTTDQFMWRRIENLVLYAAVTFKLGRYGEAYDSLSSYVESLPKTSNKAVVYYSCARDYIGLLTESSDLERNMGILRVLYGDETAHEIEMDFGHREAVLDQIGTIYCPSCNDCLINKGCYYNTVRDIHDKIKSYQNTNYPDQLGLRKIFKR